jgi:predicted NBD/HSP70 family sugar kinase
MSVPQQVVTEIKPVCRCPAPLDPGFQPAALVSRKYAALAAKSRRAERLVVAMERLNGGNSRLELSVPGDDEVARAVTLRYVERMVKCFLWSRGGYRLHVGGPAWIGEHLKTAYARGGERAFDVELMSRVYGHPFEVIVTSAAAVPAARESEAGVGGHLDGCRIGFDLGASDYKIAAVKDGEVVFSGEFPWDPRVQRDPRYHYTKLQEGLTLAATHLPRVDAIGGSSAGIYLDNEPRVASLFRSVPADAFERDIKPMFKRLASEWKVPLLVINDGEVTALAGAMSLQSKGMLGVAMGSSEAAGFMTPAGSLTEWINELAFAPVDFNPEAPPDEWSGDRGVGALYFSQQAVNKLAPAAGYAFDEAVGLPERLKQVQDRVARGDEGAVKIFETIGVYLGYTLPFYAEFYDYQHLLLLGRVTSGRGGEIVVEQAKTVLRTEFPDMVDRIQVHMPDEKSRRVGQAVAAASLPEIKAVCRKEPSR